MSAAGQDQIPLLHQTVTIDQSSIETELLSSPKPKKTTHKSIYLVLAILFASTLIFISARSSKPKPLLILISLDGTKPAYLTLGETPVLVSLAKSGLQASMQPSFPSITFPNHVTLTSGLYPESHGIVGNAFYDPVYNQSFSYTNFQDDQDPKWWNRSEPIWITAQEQGLISGNCFWPGSETTYGGRRSKYYKNFRPVEASVQLDWVLGWIGKKEVLRPDLITIYFPQIDHAGHGYGPGSEEVKKALREIDETIGKLMEGVKRLELLDVTNVVVVSDHGYKAV